MSKRGNGAEKPDDSQTALDLEQAASESNAEAAAEQDAPEGAEVQAGLVTELGNSHDGCWKVVAHGERVEISDKEWRKELTRLLASPSSQHS